MITDKLGKIESVRIQNFRLFKDSKFDFKPFTVLVGPNSSGKSSFIKSLLLLKNKKEGVIDGNSGLDFANSEHQIGDIMFCKNNKDDLVYELFLQKSISVQFGINSEMNLSYESIRLNNKNVVISKPIDEIVIYDNHEIDVLNFNHEVNAQLLHRYLNACLKTFVKQDENFGIFNSFSNMLNNGRVKGYNSERLFQLDYYNETKNSLQWYYTRLFDGIVYEKQFILKLKNDIASLDQIIKSNNYNNDFTVIINSSNQHAFFRKHNKENNIFEIDNIVDIVSYLLETYKDLIPKVNTSNIINNIGNANFIYVPPLKGLHKRFLPIEDESPLSKMLESVKFDFRKNMNSSYYDSISDMDIFYNPSMEFVSFWLKRFKIGNKIELIKDKMRGIKHIEVDGKSLVDKGYGLMQLVTIIYAIKEAIMHEGTVVLEEPETNLHPKFQSMIAEMLVKAKKEYDISFIIETHSEYFIRKLQYLTAKEEINGDDTVIYYFNNPEEIPEGEKQIKKLTIRDDGMMDGDFGEGFFDESSRLTMDLLKIQSQN